MAGKGAKKRAKAKARQVRRARRTQEAQRLPVEIVDPIQFDADQRYRALQPERDDEEKRLKLIRELNEQEFGRKRGGTPATHAHAAYQARAGNLARLHGSGSISDDQLARAAEIKAEHDRIAADVSIRSASWDTRIDIDVNRDQAWESLWSVRRAQAYTRWRAELPRLLGKRTTGAQHVLAMVVDNLGLTSAASLLRMSVRKAREVLRDALDLWGTLMGDVGRDIDERDLILAERRLAR